MTWKVQVVLLAVSVVLSLFVVAVSLLRWTA